MLVGGQGTRLRPLTLSAPKPLLPTAGVPFLAHLLARAAAGGVTHVVLATCYKAEMFAAAFGDGSAFGLSIDYMAEDVPLDTAGAIRNAAGSLRGTGAADPVVVLNSDILSGHDLSAQIDLHVKADAAVTLHLVEVDDPSRFGVVPTDSTGRVTAFLEKTPDPVTNRVNAGCYGLGASVFSRRRGAELASRLRCGMVAINSVVSYAAAQRTHEIGIRMALGAEPSDIQKMVLRQSLVIVGTGLLVGLAAAFAGTRIGRAHV